MHTNGEPGGRGRTAFMPRYAALREAQEPPVPRQTERQKDRNLPQGIPQKNDPRMTDIRETVSVPADIAAGTVLA